MILNEDEIKERMESPLNLLNRLKRATSPHKQTGLIHPSIPPTSNEVIPDLEEKIAFGSVKSKAMNIMSAAMNELQNRLPEIATPEKLARIAAEMGKVVNGMQEKADNDKRVGHIIIYSPRKATEEEFDVIDVQGVEI